MSKFAKLLLSIFFFIVSIIIAELFLRLFAPIDDPFREFKIRKIENPFIKRDFPRNFKMIFEIEDGIPGLGQTARFSTNNVGFRGDSIETEKPSNQNRVFMLGGSSTECIYIDDSESFDRVLQDELNRIGPKEIDFKVFNAGKSAEASPGHISKLVHRIIHLKPDMVTCFAGINDLTRGIQNYDYSNPTDESVFKINVTKLFLTEFQIFRRLYFLKHRFSPSVRDVLEEIGFKTNYYDKIRVANSVPFTEDKPNINLENYEINLKAIIGVCKVLDIKLIRNYKVF